MSETDGDSVRTAVAALAEATGHAYDLRGRLAGGETGAHEVVGPAGERLVFKWETDPASQTGRRRAAELAERLRLEAGWPVPRQEIVEQHGVMFVLQELVPGAPLRELTDDLLDELLGLHERRLVLSVPSTDHSWPQELLRTLFTGGNGYCRHESLRDYDDRTAKLIDRIETIGRSLQPHDLPGGDVVHWDWHPGNILESDGTLSAVVDNDFVTTGDARFDLVTLAVTSSTIPCAPGTRDRLMGAAFGALTDRQRDAYVGHLLLRILDWPIRGHRTDEIDFWLAQADDLLPA
jgi:aminoglycoside phosphotransferase (APT) family kinase protein